MLEDEAMRRLDIAYYGDDFTGSIDVMEALTLAGRPTVLFLAPPQPEELDRDPLIRCVGVAGIGRTMSPAQMDVELPPVFRALRALRPGILHYKMCSTFDSSRDVGSIGHAAELLHREFGDRPIPLVVGVPELGRWTVFGNLFARMGSEVYRLDRHPALSVHPMTPMREADLVRHLADQTCGRVDLIDIRTLLGSEEEFDERMRAAFDSEASLILFDNLDERTGERIGGLLQRLLEEGDVPVIGSSAIEYTLGRRANEKATPFAPVDLGPATQTLVVAGSRAPASEAQTRYAIEHGFRSVQVDPAAVTDPVTAGSARSAIASRAREALVAGHHVVIHTPRPTSGPPVDGNQLAAALGDIARRVQDAAPVRRLVVAGGDTSGLIARSLGIRSLQLARVLTPGAPLCLASAEDGTVDALQICLKGGQIGDADYFVRIANANGRR